MKRRTIVCRAALASILLTSAVSHSDTALGDEPGVPLPSVSAGQYDFPVIARRLDQQGRFLVELAITNEGRVTNVGILSADPRGVFDRSLAVKICAGCALTSRRTGNRLADRSVGTGSISYFC